MRSLPIAGLTGNRARAALALAGSAAALGAVAPGADAAFNLQRCQGTNINARGASFQTAAQQGFAANFATTGECGANAPTVSYDPAGSGAGRRALGEKSGVNTSGARDATVRFAGSDEPPTLAQKDQIEKGPVDANNVDATAADNGVLHVIPVAIGSVAVDVNFPEGCNIPDALLAEPDTGDRTRRLRLTAAAIEGQFFTPTTWGDLVPGITGTPTDAQFTGANPAITSCAAIPIRRVVRFDDSGTTFAFKDFMNKVSPSRWTPFLTNPNISWPNTSNESINATSCPLNSNLCKSNSNGGGSQLTLLGSVDGSIGYAVVADSRARGFESTPATSGANDNNFWVKIQSEATGNPSFDPQSDPNGFKTGGTRGANCANVAFNTPTTPASDPTLGDFSAVSGTGGRSATFYPICTLTYDLAFDDNAAVYGASPAEEQRARTVKDYLTSVVRSTGQATLAARDYAPLAPSLLAVSQGGVNAIDYNKNAAPVTPPPPPGPPPPPPGPPPIVPGPVVPSNVFTIPSASVKGTTVRLSLKIPGAGTLKAVATARYKGKTVKIGSATGNATSAGTVTVTIKTTKSALKTLKKAKKLKLSVAVTFTPTGGTARTVNAKSLTIKTPKAKKKTKK